MVLNPDPNCPRCEGRGFYESPEDGAVACTCLERARLASGEETSRLPAKFKNRTLRNFKIVSKEHGAAFDRVSSYARNFTLARPEQPLEPGAECNGLMLLGSTGSGKTHLACGALKELIDRGYQGLWWNVNDLFREMRNGMRLQTGDNALLEEAIMADALVLDDLCAEKGTEYVSDRLYAIINGRYDAMRPLIVTSNLDSKELIATLGSRIYSRLGEMCEIVHMPASDYRLAALQSQAFRGEGSRSSRDAGSRSFRDDSTQSGGGAAFGDRPKKRG
jgi:DNA replication protein DnaC